MRRLRPLFVLLVLVVPAASFSTDARADDDYPCFLQQQGPLFVAALEHDLDTSRQYMITKILGDLPADAEKTSCPAATRAFAEFRRDLTTAFDEASPKARVLDRLRPVWTKRWTAAQCAEAAALVKPGTPLAPATPDEGPATTAMRWLKSPEAAPMLADAKIAQRIKDTLIGINEELKSIERDNNAALHKVLPAIIARDKAAAMKAIDACIGDETARLAKEPAAAPTAAAKTGEGLSVDPPAPFTTSYEMVGPIAVIKVVSSTGKPAGAEDDGSLCQVTFLDVTARPGKTQADVNQDIKLPAWEASMRERLQQNMIIDATQLVEQRGIGGVEMLARERVPRNGPKVRLFLATFETPNGSTFMHCATADQEFDAALPQLRVIRDAVHPR